MPAARDRDARMRAALARWFQVHCRALPWRRTRDPYAIWISEVMLQQTTVATVLSRWQRFLDRFPTLDALALAPLDAVLAAWSGLGYYNRAVRLREAAMRLVADGSSALPADAAALADLPGMGGYTTAAVGSIAFGLPLAAVDANVVRVVARLDAIAGSRLKAAVQRRADELLDTRAPGDWNQAVMELGATVCLPREPRCGACPLASDCRAHATGRERQFPARAKQAPMIAVREVAVAIVRRGRVLLLRRGEGVELAHMWEVPRGEAMDGEPAATAARRLASELAGVVITAPTPLVGVTHTVMRRRIALEAMRAGWKSGSPRTTRHAEARWVPLADWPRMAMASSQRRIVERLALDGGEPPSSL